MRRRRTIKKTRIVLSTSQRTRKYRQWKKWLAVINQEITSLAMYRHIYKTVQTIIAVNPKLHVPSSFYDWMRQSYTQVTIISVGRLVDHDKRSISFVHLMKDIDEHPDVLSRRRFVRMYSRFGMGHFGHYDFNRFASPKAKRVNLRVIAAHTRQLQRAAERLKRYRDKRVAHHDKRKPQSMPSFDDVDACAGLLERLLQEYVLLLEAKGLDPVLPVWQYDWTQIFRAPWIEDDAALRAAFAAERPTRAAIAPQS